MRKPLTEYEKFVIGAAAILAGFDADKVNPDTTDPAELEAGRRLVAAFQNISLPNPEGGQLPSLRQQWQRIKRGSYAS
jgi:hypothetical protein